MSFPIEHGGSFQSDVNVYQRVDLVCICHGSHLRSPCGTSILAVCCFPATHVGETNGALKGCFLRHAIAVLHLGLQIHVSCSHRRGTIFSVGCSPHGHSTSKHIWKNKCKNRSASRCRNHQGSTVD